MRFLAFLAALMGTAPQAITTSTEDQKFLENLKSPQTEMVCRPVVPRKPRKPRPKKPPAPPVVIERVVEKVVEKEVIKEVHTYKKNRVRLLGGFGLVGTDLASYPNKVVVSSSMGPVLGVEYTRMVNERISVGVDLLSNQTALIGVGYDF